VPEGAEHGDIICVLAGGRVPYVLRPCDDGFYRLVGECYVDGAMHGEALKDRPYQDLLYPVDGVHRTRDFPIR
jgi:hypothetical protein